MSRMNSRLISLLIILAMLFSLMCCASETETTTTPSVAETEESTVQTDAASSLEIATEDKTETFESSSAEAADSTESSETVSESATEDTTAASEPATEVTTEAIQSTEMSETTTEAPTETAETTEVVTSTEPSAETTTETTAVIEEPKEIKNIILIIGDGMGLDHIAAGQIASGEQYQFTSWQSALSNTDSVNSSGEAGFLTDSAASATALATGTLTINGYLGKNHEKRDLKTILDYAQEAGKSVGIVTTDNLYGATPAGFSAHCTDRSASKVITRSQIRSGVDFMLGLKDDSVYSSFASSFSSEGYYYSNSVSDMDEAMNADKVFLTVDIENGAVNALTLAAATSYAIDFLDEDEDGFVLIIEQAYIDKCSHSNDFNGMVDRVYSLADTVDTVIEWIGDRGDTAVLVTADHETGGLAVSASPTLPKEYKGEGGSVYYTWGTGNHTDSNVGLFVYGFEPDFSELQWYGSDHIVKNTDVFALMKGVLDQEIR